MSHRYIIKEDSEEEEEEKGSPSSLNESSKHVKHTTSLPSDVTHVEEIIWRENDSDPSSSTACPRPKYDRYVDPCGCKPDASGKMCCVDDSCVLYACQEECSDACEARQFCGNRRIGRRQWKDLEIFDAGKKGRGLRVLEPVKKREFITEYVGIAVHKAQLEDLFREYLFENMLYIMRLDSNVYIDARKKGGIARYINHSCEPNCKVDRWKVMGQSRAAVIALKDIPPGTELTFDYQWELKRGRSLTKCYCQAPTCRGTLELPREKTVEDEELEMKLQGHWKKPNKRTAGDELNHRVVRVFFEGNMEYFTADVIRFNQENGKHLLKYKLDQEECWEDLRKEQWEVLDQEAEAFVITRKETRPSSAVSSSSPLPMGTAPPRPPPASSASSPLVPPAASNHPSPTRSTTSSPSSSSHHLSSTKPPLLSKEGNYILYLQPQIKEAFSERSLLGICERKCRVNIHVSKCVRGSEYYHDDDSDDEEEVEERRKALAQSTEGMVWRLKISGLDPETAVTIIRTNVRNWEERNAGAAGSGGGGGMTGSGDALASFESRTPHPNDAIQEMIIPRAVGDAVESRIPAMQAQCRNVNITLAPSRSKSKAYARVVLRAALASDLVRAKEVLWKEVCQCCAAAGIPPVKTNANSAMGPPVGEVVQVLPSHVGFVVGALPLQELQYLFPQEDKDVASSSASRRRSLEVPTSPFLTAFMEIQGCSVWIQPEHDLLPHVDQALPHADVLKDGGREVFVGCVPRRLHVCWDMIQQRLREWKEGVELLHFDALSGFLPVMNGTMHNANGSFFDYIGNTVQVKISVDEMTNRFLRLDGRPTPTNNENEPAETGTKETRLKVKCAKDMVLLQVAMLKERSLRQAPWTFGSDWSQRTAGLIEPEWISRVSPVQKNAAAVKSLKDPGTASSLCLDLPRITDSLSLDGSVAVHAAVLLYRFVHEITKGQSDEEVPYKPREVAIACVFLANKAQKLCRWKPLEQVLESAYKVFYPGSSSFVVDSDEARSWEKKVLAAEGCILEILHHDVFWKGTDWIISVAEKSANMPTSLVENVMELVISGPILAAGPYLWLRCGPEYVFSAIAGCLAVDLPALLQSFALMPDRLSDAGRHVVEAIHRYCPDKKSGHSRIKTSSSRGQRKSWSDTFAEIKSTIVNGLPNFLAFCDRCRNIPRENHSFGVVKQYDTTAKLARQRRVIRGVDCARVRDIILPAASGIMTESKTILYIESGTTNGMIDIVMEGSWRGLAVADELLRCLCLQSRVPVLPPSDEVPLAPAEFSVHSAQQMHRVLKRTDVELCGCWEGTSVASGKAYAKKGLSVGAKNCFCGVAKEGHLRAAGIGWWIPPRCGLSLNASYCDAFVVRDCEAMHLTPGNSRGEGNNVRADVMHDVAEAYVGSTGLDAGERSDRRIEKRPFLSGAKSSKNSEDDHFFEGQNVAISLKPWPTEKVEAKERASGKDRKRKMGIGFSAGALQEMQVLHQFHSQIPAPQGHPNFVVPLAVVLPSTASEEHDSSRSPDPSSSPIDTASVHSLSPLSSSLDMFKKDRTNSNESESGWKRHRGNAFIIVEPTPLVLQTVLNRKKYKIVDSNGGRHGAAWDEKDGVTPDLFACWFHDILLALTHCHSNNTIMRILKPDQILLDHSGVAKFSELSVAVALPRDQEQQLLHIPHSSRSSKSEDKGDTVVSDPHQAPELLLGATRHTKASDIWSLGSIMAGILLGKNLCAGKERHGLLSSVFKVAGSPSSGNFLEAKRFPHYERAKALSHKSYKPGVDKAIRCMLKCDDLQREFAGAICLLDKMLRLDPRQRISAADALQDPYMVSHSERRNSGSMRISYAKEWINLKRNLTGLNGRVERRSKPSSGSNVSRSNSSRNGTRSGATDMLFMAGEDGDDELYRWDDVLMQGRKRRRYSNDQARKGEALRI